MIKNVVSQSLIGIFLILASCSGKDQMETYSGKSIDSSIIGLWNTTYSSRDLNNSITIYLDTLTLKSNNQGIQKIYKFKTPDISQSFQFYTENNSLHLRYDEFDNEILWTYSVRNDSLALNGNKIYIRRATD